MNANDFPAEFLNQQNTQRAEPRAQDSPSVASIGGEKPYENALRVEFGLRKIQFVQQPRYDLVYKQVTVGEYVPDLIAFSAVVVDAKVIDAITDHERGRMLNYLRITGHKIGVLLNFKRAKLEWEQMVLSNP